jgi:hypothetical protein
VVAAIRFSRSYKREFIREFKGFILKRIQKAVQLFSVTLWSINQRTTEAEELADSLINQVSHARGKTLLVQQGTERVVDSHDCEPS